MSSIFGSDKCLMNILNSGSGGAESLKRSQIQRPRELRYLKNLIVFGKPS